MDERKLRKQGRIAACVTPGAWILFLLVGPLCYAMGSADFALVWLCYLIIPLMYAGTAACAVWLVRAWLFRRVFSKGPWVLAALNAAALLAGLPMIAASFPGYLSAFLR